MLTSTRILMLASVLLAVSCANGAAPGAGVESAASSTEPAPVVLELFTSQGCSSCPAADATLSRLGHDPKLAGRVVPLAYHVDYWNYIGWRDPFSSPEWTERQYAYARAFGMEGVYTPQLVVGGRAHVNGSEEAKIRALVAEPPGEPEARVSLGTVSRDGDRLSVDVRSDAGAARETVVVLFENGAETRVSRGENAGRMLANDYVVRRLDRGGASRTVVFTLDPAWKADRLGVVAFVQDPTTMRIHGAALAR